MRRSATRATTGPSAASSARARITDPVRTRENASAVEDGRVTFASYPVGRDSTAKTVSSLAHLVSSVIV